MQKQCEFVAHSSIVNCLSISPKSQNLLATGGDDSMVHIWTSESKRIARLKGHKAPIDSVCFNPFEEYCASGSRSGAIKIFDIAEGKIARNLRGHQAATTVLNYHPLADIIVSGSNDTQVKAWDLRNKECLMTCPGHEGAITCVRFSPDGRWLVTAAEDGKIVFWDVVAGKIFHTLKVSSTYVTQLEFSPAELYLAAATASRLCYIYDCDGSIDNIAATPADASPLRRICFSAQGRCLCTATENYLRIFELPNNSFQRQVDASAAPFSCLQSVKMSWDKVADMRCNDYNDLTAACYNANFVAVYGSDVSSICMDSIDDAQAGHRFSGLESESKQENRLSSPVIRQERQSSVKSKPPMSLDLGGFESKSESRPMSKPIEARYSAYDENSDDEAEEKKRDFSDAREGRRQPTSPSKLPPKSGQDVGGNRFNVRSTPSKQPVNDKDAPHLKSGFDRLNLGGRERGQPATPDRDSKFSAQGKPNVFGNLNPNFNFNSPSVGEMSEPKAGGDFSIVGNRYQAPPSNFPVQHQTPVPNLRIQDAGGDDIGNCLDRALIDGTEFASKISHRLSSLRILQQYWNNGDTSAAVSEILLMFESNRSLTSRTLRASSINALKNNRFVLDESSMDSSELTYESRQPMVIIADFLLSCEGLKGQDSVGLTLNDAVSLLPVLEVMFADSLEAILRASAITYITLCEAFGDLIVDTRTNISVAGGVDLSRDERLRKCNICHDALIKVNNRLRALKKQISVTVQGGHKYSHVFTNLLNRLEVRLNKIL